MEQNGNGRIKHKMSLWERLYFPEIIRGMSITMRAFFRPKFVRQYPEERWVPPPIFRGRPVLVVEDETGVERCVACGLCARVCPPLAIQVQAAETELDKEKISGVIRDKYVALHLLRFLRRGLSRGSNNHEQGFRAHIHRSEGCDLRKGSASHSRLAAKRSFRILEAISVIDNQLNNV